MYSVYKKLLLFVLIGCFYALFQNCLALELVAATNSQSQVLRVASDPNNLPFSNALGEGFENKIAELVARELGRELVYVWHAQRRGFFRETLKENRADLVMGVPAGFEMALTTVPYYRSSYVFVALHERSWNLKSLDDSLLRTNRVGVQLIGDDGANTPPVHALANRGIVTNLVGFTVYGDYADPNPTADIVKAVASGGIDIGLVWGPVGGYFARQSPVKLDIFPISDSPSDKPLRFEFSIAMGVRKGNKEFRDQLNSIIARKSPEIEAILRQYNIPTLPFTLHKEEH